MTLRDLAMIWLGATGFCLFLLLRAWISEWLEQRQKRRRRPDNLYHMRDYRKRA